MSALSINIITVSRILFLIPIAILLLSGGKSWAVVGLFIAGGITDFLDGWLARRLGKTSSLGAMLDQICDKIFVLGALIIMAAAGFLQGIMLVPVLLILVREFMVSGLRELSAQQQTTIPVDKLGKIKTACQFAAIVFMLVPALCHACVILNHIGAGLLWCAALLGLISAARYARPLFKRT